MHTHAKRAYHNTTCVCVVAYQGPADRHIHIPEPCWSQSSPRSGRETRRAPCSSHRCVRWERWFWGSGCEGVCGSSTSAQRYCRENKKKKKKNINVIVTDLKFFLTLFPKFIHSLSSARGRERYSLSVSVLGAVLFILEAPVLVVPCSCSTI